MTDPTGDDGLHSERRYATAACCAPFWWLPTYDIAIGHRTDIVS